MTSVLEVEELAVEQPSVEPEGLEIEAGQRLVLNGVRWSEYEQIGEALRDRSNLRLTYDRGSLEIVTTSDQHEWIKHCLNLFFVILCEELELDFIFGGSMTFRREDLERGLEPDECYWIQRALEVDGMSGWDPEVHPAPDLVLEVEVSHTVVNRLGILAALGVPEVWRCSQGAIRVLSLDTNGEYKAVDGSSTFPGFPIEQIARWVPVSSSVQYRKVLKAFRAWVREQIDNG